MSIIHEEVHIKIEPESDEEDEYICDDIKKEPEVKMEIEIDPIAVHVKEEIETDDIKEEKIYIHCEDSKKIVKAHTIPLSSIEIYKKSEEIKEKPRINQINKKSNIAKEIKDQSEKRKSKEPAWCDICKKYFSTSSNLNRHMYTHNGTKPFPCKLCNKAYRSHISLKKHTVIHYEGNVDTPKDCKYTCDVCNMNFCDKSTLKTHNTMRHGSKYTCDICKKDFTAKGALIPHLRLHYGEKPYQCTLCDKKFTQCAGLKDHFRSHSKEKPFNCGVCQKSFTNRSYFKVHVKSHEGFKPFTCELCDKTFTAKYTLRLHQRLHTGERPYVCSFCSASFAHKNSFKRHYQIHTSVMSTDNSNYEMLIA